MAQSQTWKDIYMRSSALAIPKDETIIFSFIRWTSLCMVIRGLNQGWKA
jgi:hypothetical protein